MNDADVAPVRHAALVLAAVFVLLVAALVPLSLLARQTPVVNGGETAGAIPFGVVGLLIARRQPRNPVGWLLVGIATCLLLSIDCGFYSVISYRLGHHLPLAALALLGYELWAPGLLMFSLVILLFPDGRLPSRAGRWLLGGFLAVLAGFTATLTVAVTQAVTEHQVSLDAYDGLAAIDHATGWFAVAQTLFGVIGLPFLLWCVLRQLVGWRRSSGERRQQLKWLASGVTVAAVSLLIGLTVPDGVSPVVRDLANAVSLGILALPVCVGVAVLRYRLYDIDRIVSRTLAYAIVTGLLIGVYAGLVLLATRVLSFHTPVAVAASTLAAAALFSPLRRRVQRRVDRRFNRARYDADQMVTAFAGRLKDTVDLDSVRGDLAGVVQRALEPAHVSVWISGRE
jgi:hypothetical protein